MEAHYQIWSKRWEEKASQIVAWINEMYHLAKMSKW